MSRISGKEIFGEGARIGQPWNPAIHYSLVNLRRYIFIYLSSQSIDIKIYFVSGKIWTIIGNNPFTIYCFYLKQSQVNVTITILWWKINVFQLPSGFTIHKECSKVTPTGGYAATHHPLKKKNHIFLVTIRWSCIPSPEGISQFSDNHEYSIWLVGANLPLWKIMECSSVGMMTFPIYRKTKNVPNHQPGI